MASRSKGFMENEERTLYFTFEFLNIKNDWIKSKILSNSRDKAISELDSIHGSGYYRNLSKFGIVC